MAFGCSPHRPVRSLLQTPPHHKRDPLIEPKAWISFTGAQRLPACTSHMLTGLYGRATVVLGGKGLDGRNILTLDGTEVHSAAEQQRQYAKRSQAQDNVCDQVCSHPHPCDESLLLRTLSACPPRRRILALQVSRDQTPLFVRELTAKTVRSVSTVLCWFVQQTGLLRADRRFVNAAAPPPSSSSSSSSHMNNYLLTRERSGSSASRRGSGILSL